MDFKRKGINQLENTILLIKTFNSEELSHFKTKRAYLCNDKHPQFQFSKKVEMQRFKNQTGFRLYIEATIVIK
jgi:hypothetical protein